MRYNKYQIKNYIKFEKRRKNDSYGIKEGKAVWSMIIILSRLMMSLINYLCISLSIISFSLR